MPKRHQKPRLGQLKGWSKPDNSVVVTRPSRWANPYKVKPHGPYEQHEAVELYERDLYGDGVDTAPGRPKTSLVDVRQHLSGKDLVCSCDLDEPCHADVLLRAAAEEAS